MSTEELAKRSISPNVILRLRSIKGNAGLLQNNSYILYNEDVCTLRPKFENNDESKTLAEYLLDRLRHQRNRICMIDSINEKTYELSRLIDGSINLAVRLQRLLLSISTDEKQIVGIISENRPEFVYAYLASIFAGTIVTLFSSYYVNGFVEYIILIDDENDDNYYKNDYVLKFDNLIKKTNGELRHIRQSSDDTVTILYSSGTTGFPRGVTKSNANWLFKLQTRIYWDPIDGPVIGYLPMFHQYGLILLLNALLSDSPIIIMRRFDEKSFLQIIQSYKIKVLYLVPSIMITLTKSRLRNDYDLSSVKSVVYGGASINVETVNEFRRIIDIKNTYHMYGMTETTMITNGNSKLSGKNNSIGSLLPGIKAKIVDVNTTNTLRPLGPNEYGELCLQCAANTKGYYRNATATAELIDYEGWLHTGDIAYYDKDEDIYVVDRLKDLIKYKAFQVSPVELEAILLAHEAVCDAAIIGIPHEEAGEIPKAFVVKHYGSNVTESDLIQFVSNKVSAHKKLRGGVQFVDRIPKGPSGKILRKKIRQSILNLTSKY